MAQAVGLAGPLRLLRRLKQSKRPRNPIVPPSRSTVPMATVAFSLANLQHQRAISNLHALSMRKLFTVNQLFYRNAS